MTTLLWGLPRAVGLQVCTLAAVVLLQLGCASTGPTAIKTLLEDAGTFDYETVRIVGNVATPSGPQRVASYEMNDGTGTVLVVCDFGRAPRPGAQVGVEGTFRSTFTIGDEIVTALVEQRRYAP